MTTHVLPPVRCGDLLQLRDEDYLFGRGDIWLRVLTVYEIRTVRGKPWIFLRGRTIWAPRAAKPEHDVLVKSEAMLTSRRRSS
ncbi:hypothetical protein [Phytohabitans suffuscus]|uniref:Uncharacterized protein n=1 Tax=Phytohabitans suffuscus TaxID=624315 RepID=A0A6F8YIE5_9ACTN|nr:hypothetical protein [Phytohabitans suffuscus]BCB85850.1 hypothetical protein Psuf_031630 [Phytohabitans suffuscus]